MSGTGLRLDKWLWHARFAKSRSRARALCESGRVRLNKEPVGKAHAQVRPGDVLTFPHGPHLRVLRVVAVGVRRGPASEAETLYEDLAPPAPETRLPPRLSDGGSRPTKRDRRALDRMRGR